MPRLEPLLNFFHHLVEACGNADLETWCQSYLCNILAFIRPALEDIENSPQRWLLTFSLIGEINSSQGVEGALELLITSVIPAFHHEVFYWTDPMSKGLANSELKPVSLESWRSSSAKTRRDFLYGPIRKLLSSASRENLLPVLHSLTNIIVVDFDSSSSALSDLATVIFSPACL